MDEGKRAKRKNFININNKRVDIVTNLIDINKILGEYYKPCYVKTFNDPGEIDNSFQNPTDQN
jgi:hypothetical protein